jgi:predicted transposase YdaD
VYGKYPEFKEVDAVETLMKSRIEIAAEQGLERGLERGREQGQELERERSIRHALSRGLEPQEVASLLGVTLDDVARAAA